jgi:hypothetical protein
MELSDKRNSYGVKDSMNCYLTIKGKKYYQWTDYYEGVDNDDKEAMKERMEQDKKEYPDREFIIRKQPEGFYRVYYTELKGRTLKLNKI